MDKNKGQTIDNSMGSHSFREEAAISPKRSVKRVKDIKTSQHEKSRYNMRNKGLGSLDEVFNSKHMTFEDIQRLDYKQINGNRKKDIFDPNDFIDMAGEDSEDEVLSKFRTSKKKTKIFRPPKAASPRKNIPLQVNSEAKANLRQSYAPQIEVRNRLVGIHGPYQAPAATELPNQLNSAPRRHILNQSPTLVTRDPNNVSNNKSTKSAYRSHIEIPGK